MHIAISTSFCKSKNLIFAFLSHNIRLFHFHEIFLNSPLLSSPFPQSIPMDASSFHVVFFSRPFWGWTASRDSVTI